MIALPIAIATLLLHVATASRYGYFRDELYFIACSKHLAWGYVDQPPLVALAALLSAPFGYDMIALRLLPALAASLAALVAAFIARDLGGGRFAQGFAAAAVALTPAYLTLSNILTTTSFESLSWTLVIWCTINIVRGGGARWWIALAGAVAFGLYGKYSIILLVLALIAGLLLTAQRRSLRTPWFGVAALLALALISPNLLWQWSHGWPFFEVLSGDVANRHAFATGLVLESRQMLPNALAFSEEQFLYTNPAAAAIWLGGIAAPFALRELRDVRYVAIAYAVLLAVAIALAAKGYYIIGIYASLFAFGAVAIERATPWARTGIAVVVAAVALVALPISIPILPLPAFLRYSVALGMTPAGSPRLTQPVYAEEFGWERLARDVARQYDALDPSVRDRTAIYADTYADAGALDVFGHKYGLPDAIGSQNTYWLWGPRNYDGSTLIAVGASRIDVLKRYYRSVRLLSTSDEPMKWIVEGPAPIYLCTGPRMPLSAMWPYLRWYGA